MSPLPTNQVVSGQVGTDGTSQILQGRKVRDVLRQIYQLDPRQNPIHTVITSRSQVRPASAIEVEHLEDAHIPFWDTCPAGATVGATSFDVSNGAYHQAGDIIVNPKSGEHIRITAVSTNTLTVERSIGATAAAAIDANQKLLRLGTTAEEGARSPVAKSTQTILQKNYMEIKRHKVELTRTTNQIDLYGLGSQNERTRLRKKRGEEHARHWEETLMHGEKSYSTTSGKRVSTAGGLDEWVKDNVLDLSGASGVLGEKVLINFVGDTTRFSVNGSTDGDRVLFCGRPILNQLQNFAQGKIRHNSEKSGRYGFPVATFLTSYGELDVVYHRLLEHGYSGYGYVLDMSGIIVRPLQRTVLRVDIQDPDTDGYADEYLSEQSYSFANPQSMGVIKGAVETTT